MKEISTIKDAEALLKIGHYAVGLAGYLFGNMSFQSTIDTPSDDPKKVIRRTLDYSIDLVEKKGGDR